MYSEAMGKTVITFRLNDADVERLDRVVVELSKRQRRMEVSRSEAVRLVVDRGLDAVLAELAIGMEEEQAMFRAACRAYKRELAANEIAQEPSEASSGAEGHRFVLRNVHGILAEFPIVDGKLVTKK